MAQLALFNEGVPGHLPILWLTVALFNEGTSALFLPYGGTHDEASRRKNVAPLALKNAYLWLCLRSHIFQHYGHCYGSFILEGPAPQTE